MRPCLAEFDAAGGDVGNKFKVAGLMVWIDWASSSVKDALISHWLFDAYLKVLCYRRAFRLCFKVMSLKMTEIIFLESLALHIIFFY